MELKLLISITLALGVLIGIVLSDTQLTEDDSLVQQIKDEDDSVVVETDFAVFIGLSLWRDNNSEWATAIRAFFGVPYATPPIGQLRFAPPSPWQPPSQMTSRKPVIQAKTQSPWCLQRLANSDSQAVRKRMSEDCLYLNIHTPESQQTSSSSPVIVWLHGGFLETGGISGPEAPLGWQLVVQQRLLIVEVGFRLGALGFLKLPGDNGGGNWGLLDQRLALSWVASNISPFGGDPGRVTLAGAGSGAACAGLHLFSSGSSQLFLSAAILGGSPSQSWLFVSNKAAIEAVTAEFINRASCRSDNDSAIVRCLRDADSLALAALQPPSSRPLDVAAFPVVVDGVFLTNDPKANPLDPRLIESKPIVIGVADSEGDRLADRAIGRRNASDLVGQLHQEVLNDAFKFYPAYPRRLSVLGRRLLEGRLTAFPSSGAARLNQKLLAEGLALRHTVCPANRFADALRNASATLFVYRFAEPSVRHHGDSEDAAYFLGDPLSHNDYSEAQRDLSRRMMSALTEFVTNGKISSIDWPSTTRTNLEFLHLKSSGEKAMSDGYGRQDCQFWDDQLAWVDELSSSMETSTELPGGTTRGLIDAELEFWTRCNHTVNTISIAAISVAGCLLLLLVVAICFAASRRSGGAAANRRDRETAVELSEIYTYGNRVLDVSRPGFRSDGRVVAPVPPRSRVRLVEKQPAEAAQNVGASRPGLRSKKK